MVNAVDKNKSSSQCLLKFSVDIYLYRYCCTDKLYEMKFNIHSEY